jgi:hypothetical protein
MHLPREWSLRNTFGMRDHNTQELVNILHNPLQLSQPVKHDRQEPPRNHTSPHDIMSAMINCLQLVLSISDDCDAQELAQIQSRKR